MSPRVVNTTHDFTNSSMIIIRTQNRINERQRGGTSDRLRVGQLNAGYSTPTRWLTRVQEGAQKANGSSAEHNGHGNVDDTKGRGAPEGRQQEGSEGRVEGRKSASDLLQQGTCCKQLLLIAPRTWTAHH